MTRGRSSSTAFVLLFALLPLGCGGGDGAAERVEVRDSAGVRIIYSAGPQWDQGRAWTVDPDPHLVIGRPDGDSTQTLYRVASARRLANGDILVAQSGSAPHLRLYDPEGSHIRSFGTTGEGPAEFRLLAETCLLGDTILAHDPMLGRLTSMTTEGTLVEVRSMPPLFTEVGIHADMPVWMDDFSDCDFLGRVNTVRPEGEGPASFAWWRLEQDDLSQDSIVVVTGGEWTADGTAVRFAGMPWAVAGDSTLFVSNDADFWVSEYSKDGRLIKRFGRPHDPVAISDDDLRRLRERAGPQPTRYAKHWPAHTRSIQVDNAGHLWLDHYQPESDEPEVREWSVFDPDGRFLGVVETPLRLRITEIGEDYVLGVWRDSLDVESVRSFQLRRGG